MPITLGHIKAPFDLRRWDKHCLKVLGRKVPFGEILTRSELAALGFTAAAGLDPKFESEVK